MKNHKLKIGPIVLFAVLAVCLLIGGISARYSMERNNPKNVIDTNAFYFNSDLLKNATDDVSYAVAGNTTTMTFSLYNFEDELRYSETDIYYELAITGGTATLSVANGTLTEDAKSSQVITISGMENGQTYVVTAHGYSLPNTGSGEGYQKDLKITLNVANATSSIEKTLNDYTDYVELDVWTTGTIYGTMQITYPTGLIPDNTDSAMVGWETSTTSAITKNDGISFMNTYSSHRYRFFKVNPADTFNKNNFTVQIIAPSVSAFQSTFNTLTASEPEPTIGFVYGDYFYIKDSFAFNETSGWAVLVSSDYAAGLIESMGGSLVVYNPTSEYAGYDKTSYGPILESAFGMNVTNMHVTFGMDGYECTNMTVSPEIPRYVENMNECFSKCSSLLTMPTLPDGVTDLGGAFDYCTSLQTASTIPASVTEMAGIFAGDTSLAGTITINASTTHYEDAFAETTQPITINGSSIYLNEIAATANNGNVTVAP